MQAVTATNGRGRGQGAKKALALDDRAERIAAVVRCNNIESEDSIVKTGRDPYRTTDRYKETDDLGLIEQLNRNGWFIADYKQAQAPKDKLDRSDFKTYMAIYQNHQLNDVDGEGRVTLVQTNAKDGTQPLRISPGFDRYVCPFPMVINSQLFRPLQYKHKGILPQALNDKIVREAIEQVKTVTARIKEMKTTVLTEEQALGFAEKASKLRYSDDTLRINPADLLVPQRPEDAGWSLWKVLCRTHENLIGAKNLTAMSTVAQKRPERKARKIENIARELRINEGLWSLADEYVRQTN